MTDTRPFDPALFHDPAIDPETASLNAQIIEVFSAQPEWWIVGAQASREARRRGEGPFPAPVFSDRARTIPITGKDGNEIPLRVIAPPHPPREIYLHLHGGAGCLVAPTCKIQCWSGSPMKQARPLSPSNIAWHRNIPTPRGRMIVRPPPPGSSKTLRRNSAPTL